MSSIFKTGFTGFNCSIPCPNNYYGPNCVTYCKPIDSCSGHYTCDGDGNRICNLYWEGENCDVKIYNGNEVLDPECPIVNGTLLCRFGSCHNSTCCCTNGYSGIFMDSLSIILGFIMTWKLGYLIFFYSRIFLIRGILLYLLYDNFKVI